MSTRPKKITEREARRRAQLLANVRGYRNDHARRGRAYNGGPPAIDPEVDERIVRLAALAEAGKPLVYERQGVDFK